MKIDECPELLTNTKKLFILHELYYEGGCDVQEFVEFIKKEKGCDHTRASLIAWNTVNNMSYYFALYDDCGYIFSLKLDHVNFYCEEVLGWEQ